MDPIRFFDSVEHMEPKCPKCDSVIEYGITTEWDDKAEGHKCKNCGQILE
ncbi:hypothetical protein JW851_01730 [Candidatus Woesearchaeota archaeon]|nr:hypothetical protein [Candidatus Woesearchaeota archaeon]